MISGAGITGATAACLFAQRGFRVALLDAKVLPTWTGAGGHGRVSAISPASKNIFTTIGVWRRMTEKRFSPYCEMKVWETRDCKSDAEISFDAIEMGRQHLGFIIENDVIVSSLIEKLKENYNVAIFEKCALSERNTNKDHLILKTSNDQTITCKLLVAADGAGSKIRNLCGIGGKFFDYGQNAIVTNVTTEHCHRSTAWQKFMPTGPLALLPLSNGQCAVVWSCDNDYSGELMRMDDKSFCHALTAHIGERLGSVSSCGKRLQFPLGQHHADTYLEKRTALCGDAAHTTHPLAGLGANIGLMDAAAIAQIIHQAKSKNLDIGRQSVLRRYERWRKGENRLVLETLKAFKNLFGNKRKSVKAIRQFGLSVTDEAAPVKQLFARHAMGLSGDLPEICKQPPHFFIPTCGGH